MFVAPVIVTRMEAKALGLVRYYTGKPCKHGHLAERLVSNWTCVICNSLHVAKHERETRGTEAHRERRKRLRSSAAFRASHARYRVSDKGKEAAKRSRTSDRYKKWYEEFKRTEKYKAARQRGKRAQMAWLASDRGKAIVKATRDRNYRDNMQHRLRIILRSRLTSAVRHGSRAGSAVRDLGCSIAEFKAYIEALFLPGMSWENWNRTGWHLDHIKPLARFDLSNREQLLIVCHYSNYQPLWAKDNHRKWANYNDREGHETN